MYIDIVIFIIDEDCEYISSLDDIVNEISTYLKESKYLLEIITILRVMKRLNVNINDLKMKEFERKRVERLLIKEYELNEEEKSIVVECISYFFGDSIYNNMIIYSIRKYK